MRRVLLVAALVGVGLACLQFATVAEYYAFRFTAWDGSRRYTTGWIDERISQYAMFDCEWAGTTEELAYGENVDADYVILSLVPLDRHFDGLEEEGTHLWRMCADIWDDVNKPITWRVGSDCGPADSFRIARPPIWTDFIWDESWPDDYWAVKYFTEGTSRRFMIKVRYVDKDKVEHWFYAVPYTHRPSSEEWQRERW